MAMLLGAAEVLKLTWKSGLDSYIDSKVGYHLVLQIHVHRVLFKGG